MGHRVNPYATGQAKPYFAPGRVAKMGFGVWGMGFGGMFEPD